MTFYAPWQSKSKQQLLDLSSASQQLQKQRSPWRLFRLDHMLHKAVGATYGVEKLPTTLLFAQNDETQGDDGDDIDDDDGGGDAESQGDAEDQEEREVKEELGGGDDEEVVQSDGLDGGGSGGGGGVSDRDGEDRRGSGNGGRRRSSGYPVAVGVIEGLIGSRSLVSCLDRFVVGQRLSREAAANAQGGRHQGSGEVGSSGGGGSGGGGDGGSGGGSDADRAAAAYCAEMRVVRPPPPRVPHFTEDIRAVPQGATPEELRE